MPALREHVGEGFWAWHAAPPAQVAVLTDSSDCSPAVRPQRSATSATVARPHMQVVTIHNVLGEPLQECGRDPLTGFYRTGCCETGPDDVGTHVVCAVMTDAFLDFTKSRGNDLSTPRPAFGFAGLAAGDRWCLCVSRWAEALEAGVAPPVVLEATHRKALDTVTLDELRAHASESSG